MGKKKWRKKEMEKMLKSNNTRHNSNDNYESNSDSDSGLSYEPTREITQEEELALTNTDSENEKNSVDTDSPSHQEATKNVGVIDNTDEDEIMDNEGNKMIEYVMDTSTSSENTEANEKNKEEEEHSAKPVGNNKFELENESDHGSFGNNKVHEYTNNKGMDKNHSESGDKDPTLNLEAYFSENSEEDENVLKSPPRIERNYKWKEITSIKSPFRKGKDQKDNYSVQTETNNKKQPKKTRTSLISPDGVTATTAK